ncbi:hypothetical protein [Xanthomonas arboricola]|uniref:hypothetical protein n=1 Tax=Xanthomonas arboricola TaxID=56448 RepID=UPI002158692E|nr:hypothetical protein [Xanthomonas arboricola]
MQRVREGMQSGRYPGARKIDGLIQMPLEALAEILDPAPAPQPVAPIINPSSSRRRSAIGPRITFVRQGVFWEDVFRAIGEVDQANLLRLKWVSELNQLRRKRAQAIAESQKRELQRSIR